jgi:hypothetical protein
MVVRPGPRFSVADVHRGLVNGLRANGCTVYDYQLDNVLEFYSAAKIKQGGRYKPCFDEAGALHMASEHLQAASYRFWPDVVVLTSAFWVPVEMLGIWRMRPHQHVVAWLTESPYEDDRHVKIAEHVDTCIVNDPTNLDAYRAVNPRTWYLPQSYDPAIHAPGPGRPEWACDVAFAGTGFPSRLDFMRSVDWSGIDLRLGGMWALLEDDDPLAGRLVHDKRDCLDNVESVDLYRSARASFNLYRREATATADGWAMGPREVELAATGTFYLRDPRPEGDALLPMLPTFESAGDFADKLRWWLAHDVERAHAAAAARAAVADRTFAETTKRLLSLVDRTPVAV